MTFDFNQGLSILSSISPKILKTRTEHKQSICSLEPEPFFVCICSVKIFSISKVIVKNCNPLHLERWVVAKNWAGQLGMMGRIHCPYIHHAVEHMDAKNT